MPDQRSLDTRLEALRTVARTVAETLAEHPQIVSVILFGSGAHGAITRQSDIDLLAVCDPEIVSRPDREALLSELRPGWKIHAYGTPNSLYPTCDTHKSMDGFKVSAGYQTAKWISTVVTAVVEEGATTMDLCREVPSGVVALIQSRRILFDPGDHVGRWKRLSRTYPPVLKQNILAEGLPALRKRTVWLQALGCGENATEWNKQPRRVRVRALRDALADLRMVLLAINETYDPVQGKHLEETILPELELAPDDLVERWGLVKGKAIPGRFKDRWGGLNREEWNTSVSAFAALANDTLDMARPHHERTT